MTKLDLTKLVVSTVVGIGTAQIVHAIIGNNTQPDTLPSQVTVGAASVVAGYMAADISKQYTDQKIDEIAHWWKTNITG